MITNHSLPSKTTYFLPYFYFSSGNRQSCCDFYITFGALCQNQDYWQGSEASISLRKASVWIPKGVDLSRAVPLTFATRFVKKDRKCHSFRNYIFWKRRAAWLRGTDNDFSKVSSAQELSCKLNLHIPKMQVPKGDEYSEHANNSPAGNQTLWERGWGKLRLRLYGHMWASASLVPYGFQIRARYSFQAGQTKLLQENLLQPY